MNDGFDVLDRSLTDIRLAQVAKDDLGSFRTQRLRCPGIPHHETYALALGQESRDEAATESPGGSAHKRGHVSLLIRQSLAGNQ
jgi:hypothetical protein